MFCPNCGTETREPLKFCKQCGVNLRREQGVLGKGGAGAVSNSPANWEQAVLEEHQELKRFLRTKLYNHPKVREVMDEARATLRMLFEAYFNDPTRLPSEHKMLVALADVDGGVTARARVVADYVAGMTDRFAFQERDRISSQSFGNSPIFPL